VQSDATPAAATLEQEGVLQQSHVVASEQLRGDLSRAGALKQIDDHRPCPLGAGELPEAGAARGRCVGAQARRHQLVVDTARRGQSSGVDSTADHEPAVLGEERPARRR